MPEALTAATGAEFMDALLAAPRPGSEKILAFYDSRANRICKDGRFLYIPLDDHLCHRGDGLFESFAYRENRIFALDQHLARLKRGAEFLKLAPPVPWEELRNLLLQVCRESGSAHGDLRLFLGRGGGGFGVSPAECPVSSLYIVALATSLPDKSLYEKGLNAITSVIPPKQDYLAQIKNTSYLPNVLMAAEALEKNADVAISFDRKGNLAEAAVANVAIVDELGRFRSPALSVILPGTTLLAALELARSRMPVMEGAIQHDEVKRAREVLLLTSASLCVPITHFDGLPIGQGTEAGKPGSVAKWLRNAILAKMLATGTSF